MRHLHVTIQSRSPIENKGVHSRLEAGHQHAQAEGVAVGQQQPQAFLGALYQVSGRLDPTRLAVVLIPSEADQHKCHQQDRCRQVEGGTATSCIDYGAWVDGLQLPSVCRDLCDEAAENGYKVEQSVHQAEHVRQQLAGEAVALRMLRDHPAFEAGEQQGCSDSASDAAEHEDPEVVVVLGHAGQDVEDAVSHAAPFPSEAVCHSAHEAAEEEGGAKPSNEEPRDIVLLKAIGFVERVHIRALQPISPHAETPHTEVRHLKLGEAHRPCLRT
mmetsp:Transcript_38818/g.70506  ORF Transcript_38818/g.70506 Transcript_38818/m.70506 type:complete len:272 (+) Transcript_38818:555-1370(+)